MKCGDYSVLSIGQGTGSGLNGYLTLRGPNNNVIIDEKPVGKEYISWEHLVELYGRARHQMLNKICRDHNLSLVTMCIDRYGGVEYYIYYLEPIEVTAPLDDLDQPRRP